MPVTAGALYIDTVFASAGTVTAIPDLSQTDGSVSFAQGYGPNYELPQGYPNYQDIGRGDFNYLFNLITSILQAYQQNTWTPWITHAENGGSAFTYGQFAVCQFTDGHVYESLIASNNVDPVNDGVNWQIIDASNPITTTQIGSISTSQIQGLTSYPFGTTQFAIMNTSDIAALTTSTLAGFNTTQLAAMGAASTTQINSLTTTQIGLIKSTQIATLAASQISGLIQGTQINSITTTQVQGLSAITITSGQSLTTTQIGVLTTGNLPSLLGTTQIGTFGNTTQVAQITTNANGVITAVTSVNIAGVGTGTFGTDTGTPNNIVVTISGATATLGQMIEVSCLYPNTSYTPTLNLNGTGPVQVTVNGGQRGVPLMIPQPKSNGYFIFTSKGTWDLINPSPVSALNIANSIF